jgi:hypothetical protein
MRPRFTRAFARPGLPMAACGLLALLVFGSAVGGGFLIWDDNVNLLSNPQLWSGDAWWWMFTDVETVQRYKPLNWVLWRLLGDAAGLNPLIFHAANLVLHALNAVLLFGVARSFLSIRREHTTDADWRLNVAALGGTLFWVLHPLRTEAVAWISGAGYPLATCFALLAVRAFQRHLATASRAWQVAAFGFFVLSLLSYPAAAALPALLIVLHLLAHRPAGGGVSPNWPALLRLAVPYAVAATVVLGATLFTRLMTSGEVWNQPAGLAQVSLANRASQGVAVWVWYLEKTVLPLHLAPVYAEFRQFDGLGARAMISWAVLALTLLLSWRLRHRWPEAALLWLAFLALAIPVLGVTDLPFSPADRYTYVPALALALAGSSALLRALEGRVDRPLPILAMAGLLLAGLAAASIRQLEHWITPVAFFRHAQAGVDTPAAAADLHWRLGLHQLMAGDPIAARAEFIEVLRLSPGHPDAARYLRVLATRGAPAP